MDARDDGNRRQVLLAAAAHLFRRQGFAATTTRDIAAAADMQSGSPFYHFKSKDALLYAVMEEGMRRALARQQATLQAPAGTTFTPREHADIGVALGIIDFERATRMSGARCTRHAPWRCASASNWRN